MGALDAVILGEAHGARVAALATVKVDTQFFSASGTWTPPPNKGILSLIAEIQKGGNGGGSGAVVSVSTPTTAILSSNGGKGGDGVNGSGGGGGGGAGVAPAGAAFVVTGSVMTADQIIAAAAGSGGSLTKVTANVPSGISGVAQFLAGTTSAANFTRTYTVTTTATGPIKLYWRRESEANADFSTVSLDGSTVVSGLSGLAQNEVITTPSVPAGTHTLTILWSLDSSNSAGINGYWIYGIAHSGGSMTGGPDGLNGVTSVAGSNGGDSAFGMFSTVYLDNTFNRSAAPNNAGLASIAYGTADMSGVGYGTGASGYNTTSGYSGNATCFAASGGSGGNSGDTVPLSPSGGQAGGPSMHVNGGNGGKGGGTNGTAGGTGTTSTQNSVGGSPGAVTAAQAGTTADGVAGSNGAVGPAGQGSGGGGGGGGESGAPNASNAGAGGFGTKRAHVDATDVYGNATSVPVTVGSGGAGGIAPRGIATGKHAGDGGAGGTGFVRVTCVYIPA